MNTINVLGLDIHFEDWAKEEELPLYIRNDFEIQKASVIGIDCISISPRENLPTLASIKIQISRIQKAESLPVFLYLNELSRYRKNIMIEEMIPFTIKGKLVFLPFIGTYLTDIKLDKPKKIDKLTSSSTLLFYWILEQNADKYYISEALNDLAFSNMTITRAYRELVSTKLFEMHKDGRKIYLTTNLNKNELYRRMLSFIKSPVIKSGYIKKDEITSDMTLASESLFSDYSMMSNPFIEMYAIDKRNAKDINLEDDLVDPDKQVKLEIWDYNPLIFAKKDKKIKDFVLIPSLLDIEDERVESEINKLIDRLLT